MTLSEYARRIKSKFVVFPKRPANACMLDNSGCEQYARHCWGSSAESCGKKWSKIKSSCIKLHACVLRVRRFERTGGPSNDDLTRCTVAFYNEG